MKTNALEYLKHQHSQFRLSEHVLSSAYPVIAQIMEEYAELSNNQANDAEQSSSNCNIPLVSGSASECECKKEWLSHSTEYNVHPYGDNIEYDKCRKCGKTHNFKTF